MPEIHFRFGGSTATRTLNCADWANLSGDMPKGPVSIAASTGTLGHRMFEKMDQDEDYEPLDDLGQVHTIDGNQVTVDQKLIDKIWLAWDTQEEFFEKEDIEEMYSEILFERTDVIGGSADTVGWNKSKNIFVVGDLKTGDGEMVYAEDNDQLMFYAWLAVEHFAKDFTFDGNTRILLYILQPSERRDDPLDIWEVNLGDVIAFGKAFERAVRVSEGGLGEPTAGKWCKYCPKAAVCPAKNEVIDESRRIAVDSDDMIALAGGLDIVAEVEQWCKDVRKMAHEQLEQGVQIDGWKLVPKRATRVWNSPEDAKLAFKKAKSLRQEDYMDMDLKSPAQVEKSCKRLKIDFGQKYAPLTGKISSGTTLAKDDDPREASLPLTGLASAVAQLT